MDFGEKAQAIWEALDKMAAKSPEQYKQFINDQLNGEGAKDMWKQLGLGEGTLGAGASKKPSSEREKKSESNKVSQVPTSSYKATIPTKKRSFLTTTKERMPCTVQKEANGKPKPTSSLSASSVNEGASTSLLDDTFPNNSHLIVSPLLAQIMADEEEDEELITELHLPEEGSGDTKSKAKKPFKPLIEEL